MKLIKTISNLVEDSRRALDEAADKGVPEKELDRLEKNYIASLKLMKLYKNIDSDTKKKTK
jgi:hypothetical protein